METLDVLLVEDSPADAEMFLRELRQAGYASRWTRVETEVDFLAELEKSPDIIFSDYALPAFSGLRAMELLRASGREIPLILISGTVGEDVAVEAMRQGATDYLLKDRMVRLGPAIERALREKQMRADQRQAEIALRNKEQEQRQLLERLVQAQAAGKVGSWETDLQTLQVVWSEQTHRIFETDPATFRPTHAAFLERVHLEDRGMVNLAFENSLRDTQRQSFSIEHQICLPGSGNKIVEERWQVIRDENGRPVRAAGTCQDITERRHLEAQLRQAQKMEAVGLLAGGVAHDFNNILAIIQMQAGMLKLSHGLSRRQVDLVHEIENAAQRAAALTRQLLLFSRALKKPCF
jgi:two-component system, cell cycle sensor histidine kinase and response regulator CckA